LGAESVAVKLARAEARSDSVFNNPEISPIENGRDESLSLERPNPRDRGDFCDSERLIAGSVNLS
jgi:hypothetical protein